MGITSAFSAEQPENQSFTYGAVSLKPISALASYLSGQLVVCGPAPRVDSDDVDGSDEGKICSGHRSQCAKTAEAENLGELIWE